MLLGWYVRAPLPQDQPDQDPQPSRPDVQRALEALLSLAETLEALELDDVEPAFTSLEWPT
jgi:hypothetical protein